MKQAAAEPGARAQAALRRVDRLLVEVEERLREALSLLPAPAEAADADPDADPDVPTEVRAVVECVLVDCIRPARRDLDTAARYRPVVARQPRRKARR